MPKILINEKDRTSPGNASSYSNYTVLIPGFRGIATATEKTRVEPDTNGVYEFNSAKKFEETIGLIAPDQEIQTTDGTTTVYHYGNQMAYELLNMGYKILYKPIQAVSELVDDSFWEVFKDKANYDFRFITHGLLKSFSTNDVELANLEARLTLVNKAIEELNRIDAGFSSDTDKDTEYQEIKENFEGFYDENALTPGYYVDIMAANLGTANEKTMLSEQIASFVVNGISNTSFNQVNKLIADLAKYVNSTDDAEGSGRGDCVALVELDEKAYVNNTTGTRAESLIINEVNKLSGSTIDLTNGKYCAVTVPSVVYSMPENEKFNSNTKFPGAFHYLACFVNSLNLGFKEWYAAAGYTRGVSSYTVAHTSVKLGEIAINALEPRTLVSGGPKFACNVVANFRGSYYLWGNRTAHELAEDGDLVASHFLNIRQLCTTIKKQLYVACRRFTFDPNSDTLWVNFVNAIRPTLEEMKADQGIRDYKILKVVEDSPKKATLKAKIRIIPIEAVEDFDLEISLEDSFGETATVVTE